MKIAEFTWGQISGGLFAVSGVAFSYSIILGIAFFVLGSIVIVYRPTRNK